MCVSAEHCQPSGRDQPTAAGGRHAAERADGDAARLSAQTERHCSCCSCHHLYHPTTAATPQSVMGQLGNAGQLGDVGQLGGAGQLGDGGSYEMRGSYGMQGS